MSFKILVQKHKEQGNIDDYVYNILLGNDIDEEEYRAHVRNFLITKAKHPEAIKSLERLCLRTIKDLEEGKLPRIGYEATEVEMYPPIIKQLLYYGLIRRVFETRRYRTYLPVRPDIILEVINELRQGKVYRRKITRDQIPPDLFSSVEGYDDVKKALLTVILAEDPIHVLLVGVPASGKTLFLNEIERLKFYGVNVILRQGAKLTATGLKELLITKKPQILLLDEIDKIPVQHRKEVYSLLSGLLEYGRITSTTAFEDFDVYLDTKVIATCNYAEVLPDYLLSKFLVIRFKEYDKETFIKVVIKALSEQFPELPHHVIEYIAKRTADYTSDVRDAIAIAKLVKADGNYDLNYIESTWIKLMLKYKSFNARKLSRYQSTR